MRDEGFVRNKAIYIALGVLPDGTKEILGIWMEQTNGASAWRARRDMPSTRESNGLCRTTEISTAMPLLKTRL